MKLSLVTHYLGSHLGLDGVALRFSYLWGCWLERFEIESCYVAMVV